MINRTMKISLQLILIICLLSACDTPRELLINDVVIKEMPPGRDVAVAYLVIENNTDDEQVLNYVHSPVADRIEVHRHIYDQGVMKMREVKYPSVRKNSSLVFKPGGFHLMLFGVYEQLKEGRSVDITFEFENMPAKTVTATVKRL